MASNGSLGLSQSLFGAGSQGESSQSQSQGGGSQMTQLTTARNAGGDVALFSQNRLVRHISGSSLISNSQSQPTSDLTAACIDTQSLSQPLNMELDKLPPPARTRSSQFRKLDTDVIFDPVRQFFKTYKQQQVTVTDQGRSEQKGVVGGAGRESVIDSVSEFSKQLSKLQFDIDKFSNLEELKLAVDKLVKISETNSSQQDVVTKLNELSEQMMLQSKMIQVMLEDPPQQQLPVINQLECKRMESRSCQTSPVATVKPTPLPSVSPAVTVSHTKPAREVSTVKPVRDSEQLTPPELSDQKSLNTQQFNYQLADCLISDNGVGERKGESSSQPDFSTQTTPDKSEVCSDSTTPVTSDGSTTGSSCDRPISKPRAPLPSETPQSINQSRYLLRSAERPAHPIYYMTRPYHRHQPVKNHEKHSKHVKDDHRGNGSKVETSKTHVITKKRKSSSGHSGPRKSDMERDDLLKRGRHDVPYEQYKDKQWSSGLVTAGYSGGNQTTVTESHRNRMKQPTQTKNSLVCNTRRSPRQTDRDRNKVMSHKSHKSQRWQMSNGVIRAPSPPLRKHKKLSLSTPGSISRLSRDIAPGSSAKRRLITSPTGAEFKIPNKHMKSHNRKNNELHSKKLAKKDRDIHKRETTKKDAINIGSDHCRTQQHRNPERKGQGVRLTSRERIKKESTTATKSKKKLNESNTSVMSLSAFGCLFGEE